MIENKNSKHKSYDYTTTALIISYRSTQDSRETLHILHASIILLFRLMFIMLSSKNCPKPMFPVPPCLSYGVEPEPDQHAPQTRMCQNSTVAVTALTSILAPYQPCFPALQKLRIPAFFETVSLGGTCLLPRVNCCDVGGGVSVERS
jgi:hypothetical protein